MVLFAATRVLLKRVYQKCEEIMVKREAECCLPILRASRSGGKHLLIVLGVILALLFPSLAAQAQGGQVPGSQASGSQTQGSQAPGGQMGTGTVGNQIGANPIGSSMSTESLILFLSRHPDVMLLAKQQMAQAAGVDPLTISDQAIFDRLRQDPTLAGNVIEQLRNKGYDVGALTGATGAPGQFPGQMQNFQGNFPMSQPSFSTQAGPCPSGYMPQSSLTTPAQSWMQPAVGAQPQMAAPQVGSAQAGPSPSGSPQGVPPQVALPQNTTPQVGLPQGGLTPGTVSANNVVCVPAPAGQGQIVPAQPTVSQPNLQLQPLPYTYIPSLPDLYSQIQPFDNSTLQRFGSNVFVLGTGNTDLLPMDLPAGPDYVLGTGDELVVNIWGSQSSTLDVTVDRQGQITLPESGSVNVTGLTIKAAQAAIQKSLRTQFKDMHVEISLGRVRSVRVYVVGDVQRPGAYDVSSLSTPLNALYLAGGPTNIGSMRVLRHYRGKQLVGELDLYDFLLRGVRSGVERLLPGDTILVPPAGPQVAVNGMVRRPAIYELKGHESLKDLIDMAGGLLVSSSLREITLERIEAHQKRIMLSVRVGGDTAAKKNGASNNSDLAEGYSEVEGKRLAEIPVQDGDSVLVRPILPYNQDAVYLDGHVYEPGKYPFRKGMTIKDLLHGGKGVMPEPADRIELIRLNAPDYHPSTSILNLPDVLNGSVTVQLRPFDVVRVFGRYEEDSPTVTVLGDVIRPGDYPMAKGMTAMGLVEMAGGFRRSAYREFGDLASYTIQNGKKVVLQTKIVDFDKVLNGDPSGDVLLKPGDVLGIRELTGWQDIGSSVTVTGEVVHAGNYGIVAGERLSSVLKRAGGFREDAYPEGAVLERTSVLELGEKTREDLIQKIESMDLTTNALAGSDAGSGTTASAQSESEEFQLMRAQQEEALAALRSAPASGRLVIRIDKDISKWENTPADVEMSAGDQLIVPKKASYVLVSGMVFNQVAISYVPGKTADWYLRQAGGPTRQADRKNIYIMRVNGSIVSHSGFGFLDGGVLSLRLKPGDTIVVPEKLVGSPLWKTLLATAQALAVPALLGVEVTK